MLQRLQCAKHYRLLCRVPEMGPAQRERKRRVKVPLLDLKAQYAGIREEVRAAMDEVCDSQRFILGPRV